MFRKKEEASPAVPSALRKVEFGDVENLKLSANQFYAEGKYDQAVIGYTFAINQAQQLAIPAAKRRGPAASNPQAMALALVSGPTQTRRAAGPLMAVLHSNRAICYIKLGKYAKAFADADAATTLDETMFKAWYRKALALISMEKFYDAKGALRVATQLDPSNKEAKSLLEEVDFKMGRPQGGY